MALVQRTVSNGASRKRSGCNGSSGLCVPLVRCVHTDLCCARANGSAVNAELLRSLSSHKRCGCVCAA